jgi:fatty acid desaturase
MHMPIAIESVDINTCVYQQKPLWNTIAILYTFLGYIGGIALLTLPHGFLNALGVVLLTHSLIICAYLTHEFMHGTIFRRRRWNVLFGMGMLWMNGGCYYGFQSLTLQHIAHHIDRADVFTFDVTGEIKNLPKLIRLSFLALEWLYFPIVSFWIRWRFITAPWWNPECRGDQSRVALILTIRSILFTLLGLVSVKALLLYFLSYIGMLTVLRWMDAFQHTYEAFRPDTPLPKRDRAYEQANTFSNLLSRRYPWLNLLVLNFGYHNAHHAIMKCPWHSLHELDRNLFQDKAVHYIPIWQQLLNYHRFRITRLFGEQGLGTVVNVNGKSSFENFYGAVEVSFLTLY